MSFDLTNKNIQDTFQNLLQKTGSDGRLHDLVGNQVDDLTLTNVSASGFISASKFVGDGSELSGLSSAAISTYNNSGDDRIITSVNSSTVQGESNLTFNSDNQLTIGGDITASGDISASGDGYFSNVHIRPSHKIIFDNDGDNDQFIMGNDNFITIDGDDVINLNADTYVRILSGNLGIGLANPDEKLEVYGNIRLTNTGHITASGNISSSGEIIGSNISGTNTGDQDLSGLALKTAVSGAFTSDSASFSTRVSANEVITAKTLVSSSNQLTSSFLEITGDNVISSSTQISASDATFIATSQSLASKVGQALNTDSNVEFNSITAGTITTVNITSSFITSSTIQTSGSNVFGDELSDTQTFIGNITASGNISSSGTMIVKQINIGNLGQEGRIFFNAVPLGHPLNYVFLDGGISTAGNITASGNISASGEIIGSNLSGTNTGDQDLSSLAVKTEVSGAFTADSASFSTRISASEVVTSKTLVSSSAQIASDISGSFTAASSSFSTRISASEVITSKTLISSSNQLTNSFLEITGDNVLSSSNQLTSSFLEISGDNVLSSSNQLTSSFLEISGDNVLSSSTQISASDATFIATSQSLASKVGQALNTDSNVQFNHITASGNISSSGNIIVDGIKATLPTGTDNSVVILGSDGFLKTDEIDGKVFDAIVGNSGGGNFGSSNNNKFPFIDDGDQNTLESDSPLKKVDGGIEVTGNITASQNISSSGTITANAININGSSVLTSSPFTAAGISGSFVAASSSFSTRVSASEVVTAKTLVSSSTQIDNLGFLKVSGDNVLSSSNQLTSSFLEISGDNVLSSSTQISASDATFIATSQSLASKVGQAVNTDSDVTFNSLTANTITTVNITSSFITSSTIQTSGSNVFGDDSTDTQTFIGNITASNNISASGTSHTFGGLVTIRASADNQDLFKIQDVDNENNLSFKVDSNQHGDFQLDRNSVDKVRFNTYWPTQIDNDSYETFGGLILGSEVDRGDKSGYGLYVSSGSDSGSAIFKGASSPFIVEGNITASGNISGSSTSTIQVGGTIIGSNLSGTNTGDQSLVHLAVTGSDVTFNHITASGNISASATSTGSFGRLENVGVTTANKFASNLTDNTFFNMGGSAITGTVNGNDAFEFGENSAQFEQDRARFDGDITASQNISSSGNIETAYTGSFGRLEISETGSFGHVTVSGPVSSSAGTSEFVNLRATKFAIRRPAGVAAIESINDHPSRSGSGDIEFIIPGDISASGDLFGVTASLSGPGEFSSLFVNSTAIVYEESGRQIFGHPSKANRYFATDHQFFSASIELATINSTGISGSATSTLTVGGDITTNEDVIVGDGKHVGGSSHKWTFDNSNSIIKSFAATTKIALSGIDEIANTEAVLIEKADNSTSKPFLLIVNDHASADRAYLSTKVGDKQWSFGAQDNDSFRIASGSNMGNVAGANTVFHLLSDNAGGAKLGLNTATTTPPSTLTIGGDLFVGSGSSIGHITASGIISASTSINTNFYTLNGEKFAQRQSTGIFNIGHLGASSLNLTNITASGNISASGAITSSGFNLVGSGTAELEVDGHITASGNVDVSGDIFNTTTVQMTNSSSVVNTFSTSSHKTCKYLLQVTSGSHIQSSEMLVMLSASAAHNTEYAQINTINLVDFSSTVSASNVQLIASSSFISCSVKFVRTLI